MFKRTQLPMNFLGLVKKVNSGNVRFDLEVQRRSVWTEEQKQNLIDSLIFEYPVPPFFFVDKADSFKWTLDGQQRSIAMTEFYNDVFPLGMFVPAYIDEEGKSYDVAGLTYSELPEEVKTKLNSTNVSTYTFTDISEEEVTIMFKRLNAGSPFKKIELIRIDMPTALTAFINEISKDVFFSEKIALSDKSRVHFSDQELILQTFIMFFGEDSGFTGKEIQEYTLSAELNDDEKLRFMEVLEYVNKAFQIKQKYLKKSNVPVVFKVAEIAMNSKIEPQDFFSWVTRFYETQKSGSPYNATISSGSARKENVTKRLEIITKAYQKGIDSVKADRIAREKADAKAQSEKEIIVSLAESEVAVSTENKQDNSENKPVDLKGNDITSPVKKEANKDEIKAIFDDLKAELQANPQQTV
jgi:hypothetical protein